MRHSHKGKLNKANKKMNEIIKLEWFWTLRGNENYKYLQVLEAEMKKKIENSTSEERENV